MKISCVLFVCSVVPILAQAQDNPGFINIDCGAPTGYRDDTLAMNYTTDAGLVNSGENFQISSSYFSQVSYQHLRTLRGFPNGTRNCYTLQPSQGKNNKYLIRASFSYGNYDGRSQSPTFDLYIDVNYWNTISPSTYSYEEVIYTPSRDYIQVCLVNLGTGTPFISALELRLLDSSTYASDSSKALVRFERANIGSSTGYRHPQDDYDRIWVGELDDQSNGLYQITNTTVTGDLTKNNNNYKVPGEVLMTAERTNASNYYWYKWWKSPNSTYQCYIYLHFAEIEVLQPNQSRAFKIFVQGNIMRTVIPEHLKPVTVESLPVSGSNIIFNISATEDSNLPPFLNAVEIYYATDLVNSQTDLDDINAITGIKNTYGVIRDSWQGDPCAPRDFIWTGLGCNQEIPPRIASLNLTSSGLKGTIANSFSNLTALVSLDLSFNQLSGQLPEFLAQMPNLKFLNLSENNLQAPIPAALKNKMTAGTMQINLTGNPVCQTEICISSTPKKKTAVVPITIGVAASVFLLAFLTVMSVFYIRNKRRGDGSQPIGLTGSKEDVRSSVSTARSMESVIGKMTRAYTSSEVSIITQDFKVTIGHGGFGSVFLGTLTDGTKVAVKVLSQSSKQGYKEFQAEAQLLMIVHHKNLVSLLGYCDEFENMALIYELMPNGNLRQHLSENSANVLGWIQRLKIAIDAAQGLEYLHNGCKPPIVHRDLKTANILLDENMQARIADFGLSRAYKPDHESYISTLPAGTPGYLDPAFHTTATLNRKSDLYSFGIILFELITGHPAIIRNPKSSVHIVQWVIPLVEAGDIQSIADPRMHGQFNTNSIWKMIEIAVKCVDLNPTRRPDMNLVLSELKQCLAIEISSRGGQGIESSYLKSNSFEMNSLELTLPSAR